jgi:hypothetical protein
MEICGHNIKKTPYQIILDKYVLKNTDDLKGEIRDVYLRLYTLEKYMFVYKCRFRLNEIDFDEMRELGGLALPWNESLLIPYGEYKMWADLTDEEIEEMVG